MFPRRVRAMVIDVVVDPRIVTMGAAARFASTVATMDRGLLRFEPSLCQAAGSATARYPPVWRGFWRGCGVRRSPHRRRAHGAR